MFVNRILTLKDIREKGLEIDSESDYNSWRERASNFITIIKCPNAAKEFMKAAHSMTGQPWAQLRSGAIGQIEGLINLYQMEQANVRNTPPSENNPKNVTETSQIIQSAEQKKVFIVHGHNNEVKESVARFIEKLQLEAVILHEQPNKGRTIIEKFVEYSDVGFAVILLTADDVGAKKAELNIKLIPRARQNVILELGYFLGRLGREKVFVLYENGVEIPSDYHGVLFEPLDNKNNWKFSLAKELKEAKFEIDLNKVL